MEQVRSANRDNLTARVVLAVFYEQEGRHGEASTVVREIQRVRPDLTAAEAIEIIPGLERMTSAEEFAQFPEHLRSAGLR
jgi:hypothetical protein